MGMSEVEWFDAATLNSPRSMTTSPRKQENHSIGLVGEFLFLGGACCPASKLIGMYEERLGILQKEMDYLKGRIVVLEAGQADYAMIGSGKRAFSMEGAMLGLLCDIVQVGWSFQAHVIRDLLN